jgi:sugar lactone lactonase YvrE
MIIDGKQIHFNGKPAEVAVDPITLSADKETIYFGAMNGRTWYRVPARLFREGASDAQIAEAIAKVGRKPISDGAATDTRGNHFFTNLTEHGIDVLTADGKAQPFVRDARMVWPDGVQFGSPSSLYVSVNQLNTTPAFTGGEDEGNKPYYILRVKTEYK